MARFREYSYEQTMMLPVALSRRIAPGTFEHAINHLVDHYIDQSVFEARYINDETGAPAIDPAISSQDRAVRLLPGHPLKPGNRSCVRRERCLYGTLGRHAAPLHQVRQLHLIHG
jgi:hypothetical protein